MEKIAVKLIIVNQQQVSPNATKNVMKILIMDIHATAPMDIDCSKMVIHALVFLLKITLIIPDFASALRGF